MHRGRILAVIVGIATALSVGDALAQMRAQATSESPALEATPSTGPGASPPEEAEASKQENKEKLSRVWLNEPPLVRLARDKFGSEFTENDAKFFNAVATSAWADYRASKDTVHTATDPKSWDNSPRLKASRINWLYNDPAAVKLITNRGVCVRGARIEGSVDLYRCTVPASFTFQDCMFATTLNLSHATLQYLDFRNCCTGPIKGRNVQITENIYLLKSAVFGGIDFVGAKIGGDFDFSGGFVYHTYNLKEPTKLGLAINLHDAKIGGSLNLSEKFHAMGQVRLINLNLGRTLACNNGKFNAAGQVTIDARSAQIAGNILFTQGFSSDGGISVRRARIGGDLDCSTARILSKSGEALNADLVNVGGLVCLCDGFHAEGEVRLVQSVVGGDVTCNNGHFLNPKGAALSIDGATIGKSLRFGVETYNPRDSDKDLPHGFLARGAVSMWGSKVELDLIATGMQIEAPGGFALQASNIRVGSRMDMSETKIQGLVSLTGADIEHDFDMRAAQLDASGAHANLALLANGMHVGGNFHCNQNEGPDGPVRFTVKGRASFQFVDIALYWDLRGAQFICPGDDALDASDAHVGGFVNLDNVLVDGRATFSRAKIESIWIISKTISPEKMLLDMRFAHIWVIKDDSLKDWPPAGKLQLEGLVYDHFDDDSPLDVNDRLQWLRLQYSPNEGKTDAQKVASDGRRVESQLRDAKVVKRGSPEAGESADSKSITAEDLFGHSPATNQPNHSHSAQLAKHDTRSQNGQVIPADFNAPATMPAPQMVAPTPPPMMTAPPTPQVHPKRYEMVIPEESTQKPGMEAPTEPEGIWVATNGNAAEDEDATKETKAADAKTANTATRPDPATCRYVTQPYTQLASVYRAIGQDEEANAVLVARAERLGELASPFSAQGLWYRYFGRLIGYGYEPFRAIKIGVAITLLGALIFALGARRNLMAETKLAEQVLTKADESGVVSPSYPRFNALVYSLDVFLPFVELNQVCYWIPGEKSRQPRKSRNCLMHIGPYSLKWSSVLHAYLWFQTLAGWTLCTLLAAAVTGIVQS